MCSSSKVVKIRARSFSRVIGAVLLPRKCAASAFKEVVGDALVALTPTPTTDVYSPAE